MALAAACLNFGVSFATADDSDQPAMAGPLTPNANPLKFDAGPLGSIVATGALTGLAQWQSNPTPGDQSQLADVSNAQVFFQKTDGVFRFFIQGGVYSVPALGTPYLNSIRTTNDLWGPIPQAYIKLAPNESFSIIAGKLPSPTGPGKHIHVSKSQHRTRPALEPDKFRQSRRASQLRDRSDLPGIVLE